MPGTSSLARADATLRNGARFLAAGLRTQDGDSSMPAAITGRFRARVIGNGLRELDRFLDVLMDEAAPADGHRSGPAQRHTANKLRALFPGCDRSAQEHARLVALSRTRACLFYCGGRVLRGDARDSAWLTVGWSDPADRTGALHRVAVGEQVAVTSEDVADVCRFYVGIATRIAAAQMAVAPFSSASFVPS